MVTVIQSPHREQSLSKLDDYVSGKYRYIQPKILIDGVRTHITGLTTKAKRFETITPEQIRRDLILSKKSFDDGIIQSHLQTFRQEAENLWKQIGLTADELVDLEKRAYERHLTECIEDVQIYLQREYFFAGSKNAIVFLEAAVDQAKKVGVRTSDKERLIADLIRQLEQRPNTLP